MLADIVVIWILAQLNAPTWVWVIMALICIFDLLKGLKDIVK